MSRNQKIAVAVGLLISAVFLWLAFRDLQPELVLDYIQQASLPLLLLGGAVYYLAMLVITLRWQFLLRSITPTRLRQLYQYVSIGYMGNNVYPFRAGEILRIVMVCRRYAVRPGRVTTTVIVERVFDGIVMLTFVILGLLFVDLGSPEIEAVVRFAAPVFFVALAVFLFLAARPQFFRRVVQLITAILPDKLAEIINNLAEEVIDGLQGLRTPRDFVGTVFTSYLTWTVEASVYWIVAFAFGLELGFEVMLIVVGAVNLAGLIPASPGQIGVFEFFASRVLISVGIAEEQAIAYALLVHIVIWLPPTLLGFAFLVRTGLGLSALTHAQDLEAELDTGQR